jgi:hypothetical protein
MGHRDDPGGLFIGASKLLLALMNTAPAELLHHLFMQHFSLIWLRLSCSDHFCTQTGKEVTEGGFARSGSAAISVAKKNAGYKAGVGIQVLKNQQVFQGIRCLARPGRVLQQKQRGSLRSSSVH